MWPLLHSVEDPTGKWGSMEELSTVNSKEPVVRSCRHGDKWPVPARLQWRLWWLEEEGVESRSLCVWVESKELEIDSGEVTENHRVGGQPLRFFVCLVFILFLFYWGLNLESLAHHRTTSLSLSQTFLDEVCVCIWSYQDEGSDGSLYWFCALVGSVVQIYNSWKNGTLLMLSEMMTSRSWNCKKKECVS